MKRIALLLALAPSLALADKSYNDAGQTITHDCDKDGSPTFNGAAIKATVTGKCKTVSFSGSSIKGSVAHAERLSISGSMNELTVDHADKLSVSGSKNTISYKHAGKVDTSGVGNKVTKLKEEKK